MDANELRAMCELLKRNELIGVPRVVVEALLSRLDAEDAMETYKIDVEFSRASGEWSAYHFRDDAYAVMVSAVGATSREAVEKCVAKIKEQTKEDDDA